MRVLHFYRTALPETMAGIPQVINQIAMGASQHGVEIDILSLTSENVPRTIEVSGYHLHRARLDFEIASTGFSLSAFLRFAQLAKKADVIHYHFPWPFMDIVHFVTRVKKPTLVTYHSDIVRQRLLLKIYHPLMSRFLGNVDRIVATSANYLETSDILERYRHKVSVIPIGLDQATYPEASSDRVTYWRDRLGQKFFLFIGVLRYYKGLDILVKAAHGAEYPIIIVGAGPTEKELKEQVAQLGLNNVIFLGYVSDEDKVALLTLCYGVVFPSHMRSEAFGVSLLEGAMYGKPMVSSEIGTGTSFVNVNDETGLVVPPGDPLSLRKAMDYLWTNPDRAAEMGKCAQARYQQYFTAERMLGSYVDIYNDLVKHSNRNDSE